MSTPKTVFKGRLLRVVTKKKRLPNGHSANLELVEHPGAVLIIPFLTKKSIILLRQFRPVINTYIYELPAGTLEKGERPLTCARREIIEETGYAAKKFINLGHIFPVPGYSTEKITMYKAEQLFEHSGTCEADEVITTSIITKAGMSKLFRTGKIVDAKTICALALCGWL